MCGPCCACRKLQHVVCSQVAHLVCQIARMAFPCVDLCAVLDYLCAALWSTAAATAGLRGRASQHEGLLLACACKASAHQPLLLPPHAALAAALEARGQHSSAVAALQYCLALLQAGMQQGSGGLAALGLTGFGQGSGQATHRVVLLQAAGFEGSEGVASPESVQVALEIALARNLALAGQYASAVQLYGKLEQQGSLGSNPLTSDSYSWVCYGYAAQQLGQAGLCSRVLQQAVEEAGSNTSKLHAVMALLQVGCFVWSCVNSCSSTISNMDSEMLAFTRHLESTRVLGHSESAYTLQQSTLTAQCFGTEISFVPMCPSPSTYLQHVHLKRHSSITSPALPAFAYHSCSTTSFRDPWRLLSACCCSTCHSSHLAAPSLQEAAHEHGWRWWLQQLQQGSRTCRLK